MIYYKEILMSHILSWLMPPLIPQRLLIAQTSGCLDSGAIHQLTSNIAHFNMLNLTYDTMYSQQVMEPFHLSSIMAMELYTLMINHFHMLMCCTLQFSLAISFRFTIYILIIMWLLNSLMVLFCVKNATYRIFLKGLACDDWLILHIILLLNYNIMCQNIVQTLIKVITIFVKASHVFDLVYID